MEPVLREAGTPGPLTFLRHRPLGEGFLEGTAYLANAVIIITVPIASAILWRLRFKFSSAGTLAFAYLRPPPKNATAYTATPVPHADVAVAAATEASADVSPGGESLLRITFTATDAGVITFADQSQL